MIRLYENIDERDAKRYVKFYMDDIKKRVASGKLGAIVGEDVFDIYERGEQLYQELGINYIDRDLELRQDIIDGAIESLGDKFIVFSSIWREPELVSGLSDLFATLQRATIKDGVNFYHCGEGMCMRAYNGNRTQDIYFFPVDDEVYDALEDADLSFDNYDESYSKKKKKRFTRNSLIPTYFPDARDVAILPNKDTEYSVIGKDTVSDSELGDGCDGGDCLGTL